MLISTGDGYKFKARDGYSCKKRATAWDPMIISNGADILIVLIGGDQSGACHVSMIWSPIDSPQYTFNITHRDKTKGRDFATLYANAEAGALKAANEQIAKWLSTEGYYET